MRTVAAFMLVVSSVLNIGLVSAQINAQANTYAKAWVADAPYRFGVFPYFSSNDLQAIYQPVADRLGKQLNHPVEFMTESSHKRFIHKLNNEYYDFAIIPPFWLPVAIDKRHYLPLLKMQEPFSAQLLVLDNSPYNALSDLQGKIIATPPSFTPVVNLAVSSLMSQGMTPGKDFVFNANETVGSCLKKVMEHLADACVSPPFAPSYFERKHRVKFRSVMSSRGIPGVALVAHSRVTEAQRQQLRQMFQQLAETEPGKRLLKSMQTRGFVPLDIKEYDEVRKMMSKSRLIH